MRWTEHQQAQLREMGLRLWGPGDAAPAAGAAPALPAPQADPAPLPHPVPVPMTEALPPAPTARQAQTAAAEAPTAAPAARRAVVATPRPTADRADAASIAQLDWPALQTAVADCRACGLCEGRHQTVFGTGHPRAHCMVVGEAPGEQEDLAGEPFVGPSGQLLDRMLAALGLSRGDADPARQVYIANTLKCRPPRNRNPSPEELATCQPFLERQVALVQPRVILAMGRFAVQSLLGSDEAIGKLRGRLHQWHGVPLVVTYHPAYLLRQPADKARAWDDLCLAASCLDGPPG
jgi:uracil-DNA glycosylase